MLEVYTGYKPGRPALLLVLSASILALTLGLAWAQTQATRLLAPEYAVDETPLLVRPPRNWRPDANMPGRFLRVRVSDEYAEQGAAPAEQYIQFAYERRGTFVPPLEIIEELRWVQGNDQAQAQAAKIGPYDGVQVIRSRERRFRNFRYVQENVLRVACSPRGDVIRVEYEPLLELTPGDLELLNVICASARLRDEPASRRPDRLLDAAGLRFPVHSDWVFSSPDFVETPGLYLGGKVGEVPCWAIGIFRTWLSERRDAEAVLRDFAINAWGSDAALLRVPVRSRADGSLIATVRRATRAPSGESIIAGRLVARDDDAAALLVVCAAEPAGGIAEAIADDLALALEFTDSPKLPRAVDAQRAGRALVEMIEQRGASAFLSEATQYFQRYGERVPNLLVMTREAEADGAWRGGYTRLEGADARVVEEFRWTLASDSRTFTAARSTRPSPSELGSHTEDKRLPGAAEVSRSVVVGGRTQRFAVPVGPEFVCPPLEIVAAAWMAQQQEGAALIELLAPRRATTRSVLLRPLPPDASGRRRTLRIDDYWPRGVLYTFDAALNLERVDSPGTSLRRVDVDNPLQLLRPSGPVFRRP